MKKEKKNRPQAHPRSHWFRPASWDRAECRGSRGCVWLVCSVLQVVLGTCTPRRRRGVGSSHRWTTSCRSRTCENKYFLAKYNKIKNIFLKTELLTKRCPSIQHFASIMSNRCHFGWQQTVSDESTPLTFSKDLRLTSISIEFGGRQRRRFSLKKWIRRRFRRPWSCIYRLWKWIWSLITLLPSKPYGQRSSWQWQWNLLDRCCCLKVKIVQETKKKHFSKNICSVLGRVTVPRELFILQLLD